MRKKNIGDLASKQTSGGSHAKEHPSGCKEATIEVQGILPQTAYLYSLSV